MPTDRIHVNNYASTLNGAIDNITTSIVITSATDLPTLSGSQYYFLTLEGGGNVEIVKVTARTTTTLTVVRGQDGTSGTAFSDGAVISARLTREAIDSKLPDDEHVLPATDSTYDLGEDATRWNDLWLSGGIDAEGNMQLDGNLTIGGTVDGRDVATDGTKLDGIESGADVTDETNVTAALDGATLSNIGTPASADKILIQDNSASDELKTVAWSEVGGGGSAASQATMEAATDTSDFVTAGRTQYHPGVAKVWCTWNSSGTISDSYNVDSITDNGTGDFTVNITTDFSSADYCVTGTSQTAALNSPRPLDVQDSEQAAGSCGVATKISNTGSLSDATLYYVAMYGDQ